MIKILVESRELFNNETQEFLQVDDAELVLEHSLISISKWESKWNVPYLSLENKTEEQKRDYIRCMTMNHGIDPLVYSALSSKNMSDIIEYLNAPMTATVFNDAGGSSSGGVLRAYTSEEIYSLMIMYNIPFACQKWHINRLLTLIRVCDLKNRPPEKLSANEIRKRNHDLNEQRKRELNTKG